MPPPSRKLSVKLVCVALAFLMVALAGIGFTLYESWKLEGGAAAINDLGSQRMRSFRIAYLVTETLREPHAATPAELEAEMKRVDDMLALLQRGDPARPLVLPRRESIRSELAALRTQWREEIVPVIGQVLAEPDPGERLATKVVLRTGIEAFADRTDALVLAIERNNAANLELLRFMQLALIALAVAGTVALIFLMFLLVVRPVEKLSEGIGRMTAGDFAVRLPVETRDEFGELARGFNAMAARLEELYTTLEHRVAVKTREFEQKNRELTTLYDIATLLNEPATLEALCRSFLTRLQALLGAQAGAVRLIDPASGDIHLYVHDGLTPEFAREEQCVSLGECLCGEAVERDTSVVQFLPPVQDENAMFRCQRAGFQTVSVFAIRFHGEVLGIFNLYFGSARVFTSGERDMLEALGRHLGVAIENQRLISRVREMAVSEERNFLAQELHDSIAQSLAFLNIEVQMLDGALARSDVAEARELLGEIRKGVQESYENVRELLVHFRTRVKQEDIALTIRQTLERFERQTGIATRFMESGTGVPLPPDEQLQVLHILQEALSNVRKHAAATLVEVEMERDRVYRFRVRDNGRGFDPAEVARRGDGHVGLRIMQERAARIGAHVNVSAAPGRGAAVTLTLPVLAEPQSAGPRAAALLGEPGA
jgi:two-component system, NarL family, nitrate/nitrite sensor histidine kinase NarX